MRCFRGTKGSAGQSADGSCGLRTIPPADGVMVSGTRNVPGRRLVGTGLARFAVAAQEDGAADA